MSDSLLKPVPVTQAEVEVFAKEFTETLRETLVAKNLAYNGASFQQGFAGSIVHLSDKFNRLISLLSNPKNKSYESLSDTALDMAGYSALLYMMLSKQPTEESTDVAKSTFKTIIEQHHLSNLDNPETFFTAFMSYVLENLKGYAKKEYVEQVRTFVNKGVAK